MNVPIAESYHQFIRDAVQSGRFASESAMVEEAISLLLHRELTEGPRQPANGQKSLDAIQFESK